MDAVDDADGAEGVYSFVAGKFFLEMFFGGVLGRGRIVFKRLKSRSDFAYGVWVGLGGGFGGHGIAVF